MEKKLLTKLKASKQPRKQRKYRANSPLHLRKKFVHVNLSKPLREKQGKRNIQLKKGDTVKIMRGKFRGKTGKALEIKLKESRIVVEGIQVKKQDGSKANVKMQPSNLQIIELSERVKVKKPETEVGTKKPIKAKAKAKVSEKSATKVKSPEKPKLKKPSEDKK